MILRKIGRLIFFLFAWIHLQLLAKSEEVPLMPMNENVLGRYLPNSPMPKRTIARSRAPRYGLGLEGGALGRSVSSRIDALGLNLTYGLRLYGDTPIGYSFSLKPSLGYFRQADGVAAVSAEYQVFEAGLGLKYIPLSSQEFSWGVGIYQRVDYILSTLSAFGNSNTSAAGFRYRVGPGTGFSLSLGSHLSWVSDVEVTSEIESYTPIIGASTGLTYHWGY